MRQILSAQLIERALGLVLADADEFLRQLRVRAGLGFVDQLVVARQPIDAHLVHRGGNAKSNGRCG
jgi:hypothetical protein